MNLFPSIECKIIPKPPYLYRLFKKKAPKISQFYFEYPKAHPDPYISSNKENPTYLFCDDYHHHNL